MDLFCIARPDKVVITTSHKMRLMGTLISHCCALVFRSLLNKNKNALLVAHVECYQFLRCGNYQKHFCLVYYKYLDLAIGDGCLYTLLIKRATMGPLQDTARETKVETMKA